MRKEVTLESILIVFNITFFAINASAETHENLTYVVTGGEVTITGCNVDAIDVVIPDKINGYSVTCIEKLAFQNCTKLENITIPHTVTSIYYGAFSNCSNLATVLYDGTEADWKSMVIGTENSSLIDADMVYVARTTTTVSGVGEKFTITPINVKNGKIVILALYDGDNCVEIQYAIYEGEPISLTTTKEYTNAKVMIWENMTSLKPVCDVEIVK